MDVADQVCADLEDPSLQDKMRHEGLLRAREFSWARAARQTAQVYRSVVGET